MKKQLLLFALAVLAFAGCKKLDTLTQFNLQYKDDIVVPASTGINLPFNIMPPERETNTASTFSINNTQKNFVEDIYLTTLELQLTAPSNGDLSFLKAIDLYISASGLPETKIAWKDTIPSNVGKTLYMDLTSEDLKDYLKEDKISYRIHVVTDQNIYSDQHVSILSVFKVKARI